MQKSDTISETCWNSDTFTYGKTAWVVVSFENLFSLFFDFL